MSERQVKNVISVMMVTVDVFFPTTALHHTYTQNQLMELFSLVRFLKTLVQMKKKMVWVFTRTA